MKYLFLILFLFFSSNLISQQNYYYVSPNGNDNNPGSKEAPFLSIEKAIEKAGEKREEISIAWISLAEGIYHIENTISLNENHNHLFISGEKGKEIILTGGKQLDISRIKSIKNTEYENMFKNDFLEHIYMVDLKEQGLENYGILKPVGFGRPFNIAPMELFINQNPGHLARWPNENHILITDVIQSGSTKRDELNCCKGGTIKYEKNPSTKWNHLDDIWIEGYFHHGYALDAVHVKEWGFENKTITTTHPHQYGFASGYDWNKFYAYNIPEEIDTEKEYYIDREKGILFFYSTEEIKSLEVSLLEHPFFSIENATNITINNITFQSSRSFGIYMAETESCNISNCTFKNLGSLAIWMGKKFIKSSNDIKGILEHQALWFTFNSFENTAGKNNTISQCKIYNTGAGGIILSGGNRKSLEGANNKIENCEIHDFNRIEKSYRSAIKISGVGNTIAHCKIYNGMNQAILLQGNNHLIEYNDIHDVCLDVDDAGALYYGRNPSERGHVVRHNYFHHIGGDNDYQTSAIYHDDGACGMEVYGNIFLKAGSIAVFLGGGNDNYYHHNLFLDGMVGIHIDDRLLNWNNKFIQDNGLFHQLLDEIKFNEAPYATQYPSLANYWNDQPGFPKRNIFESNIFCEMGALTSTGIKLLDWKESNISTSGYPSIWKKEMDNRNFKPNDMYLPRPTDWKELEKDKMGIVPVSEKTNVLEPRW